MRSRGQKLVVVVVLVVAAGAVALVLAVRAMLGGDAVRQAIETQASRAMGRPVRIASAVPRLFPRASLRLAGITIGEGPDLTIEHASISTNLLGLLSRRVEEAEIGIERSRIDLQWALALFAALSDAPSGAGDAASPLPLTVVSIRRLALRDVELVSGSRSLLVDLDSTLTERDRLEVTRLRGRSEGSDLTATGTISSLSRRTAAFDIEAASLDLDGLLAFLAAATPAGREADGAGAAQLPAALPSLNLQADIRAAAGRAFDAPFTNLAASCRMSGDDVRLDGLHVELFGGRFDGSVVFAGARREPLYEWKGTLEGMDAAALAAFAGAGGSLTGRLGGTVSFSATGADPLAAVRRARGTARIAVTDGRMPGLEIVRPAILAFGHPTGERPAGSGEAFTRLAATLGVANQTFSTRDLSLASRDLDLSAAGTLALATQAIDFTADVVLSKELSAQSGRDLYRLARENERVVLPVRITGTVASPSVFVDIEAALKRALRNRAEDELKSLLDRLRGKIIR
ncbi:MAG TPA: AsmA-like C-terminal region-containing protein [Vicinamibacterales bacterium]|nr:AsmA-like C-terminal region-containing protein [Vicinamibacterales bacterium]